MRLGCLEVPGSPLEAGRHPYRRTTASPGAPRQVELRLVATKVVGTLVSEMKSPEERCRSVCVYAASSKRCHPDYHDAARRLGLFLAERGFTITYGGGAAGLMGAMAEGALSRGGRITGVIPRFMKDLEWGHTGLTELQLVEDMHTRKQRLLAGSDAVVALPGGTGTLEELLEAITLKRLGLYLNPIVLVNTRGFYNPLLQLLASAVEERFMDQRHLAMWQVVNEPEQVVQAFESAAPWSLEARSFAAL